jgi:hypothetical protein
MVRSRRLRGEISFDRMLVAIVAMSCAGVVLISPAETSHPLMRSAPLGTRPVDAAQALNLLGRQPHTRHFAVLGTNAFPDLFMPARSHLRAALLSVGSC